MNGTTKRVRFVDVPPRTPSPASSTASESSSSTTLFTPPWLPSTQLHPVIVRLPEHPLLQQRRSPAVPYPHWPNHPTPALIVASPQGDLVVDPVLAAATHSSDPPPLHWDVKDHPNAIELGLTGSPRKRELKQDELARCAVRNNAKGNPLLLRRMVLTFPGLPIHVEITPASDPLWTSMPLPYLTVGDVLYGLYKALRTSVEPRELNSLEPAHRQAITRAYEKRLHSDPQNYGTNVQHGVRRIDYLGHKRLFSGLRPASNAEHLPPSGRQREVFVVQLAPVAQ